MDINRSQFPTAARLQRFIRAAKESMDSHVQVLADFVKTAKKEFAGPWWGVNNSINRDHKVLRPYSMLGEMLRTYHPHLMGDGIMPVVEPMSMGNRAEAKLLQLRLRRWVDDTAYAALDEKLVMDALVGVSVQYVARNAGGPMFTDGTQDIDVGTPVVLRVPIDRMIVSPGAESWDTADGIGHGYEADRGTMLDMGVGDPEVLTKLSNSWDRASRAVDERDPKYTDTRNEDSHLSDKVWLYDLCFMHAGRRFCCTLPGQEGIDEFVVPPYEIVDEPEGSRYIVTALNSVNDSIMPLSPAMCLMDAHLSMNRTTSKLMEQIETLRRKFMFRKGQQQQVMQLLNSKSDDFVEGDPESVREYVIGGMVKELVEGYQFLELLGKKVGPNVDVLSGQDGQASESATSTSIRAGNGAVVMGYWKKKIAEGRTMAMRRVAAMLTNSHESMQFEMPVGPGIVVPVVWEPGRMRLSYDQFKYSIKPNTNMAGMDARAKLRSMAELFNTIPGMVQVAVGLGGDPAKVIRVLSDLAECPELDEILPTPDTQSIQMLLLQRMGSEGKVSSGGTPKMGGGLPASGPMNQSAQIQSDVSRAIPA